MNQIVKTPLPLNSLVQGIWQRTFSFEARKLQDYAQNARNQLCRQGTVQGIQGISRQTSEEFGLTCCFPTKTAKRAGKRQGMPGLTVQWNPDEAGIALIQFSTELFPQALEVDAPSKHSPIPSSKRTYYRSSLL
jgi:hypothetical protein